MPMKNVKVHHLDKPI